MSNTARYDRMVWKTGDRILDTYIVRKTLGKGGNGTVYLVDMENRPDRQLAVKTLRYSPGKMKKSSEALLGELQAWSDIPPHPNIVTCRFFRTIEQTPVVFADYIDGGTLSSWIIQEKIPDLKSLLDIAIQIIEGLRIAHIRGLIHQDIKPANILMTHDGCAKITDFGLALVSLTDLESSSGLSDSSNDSHHTYKGLTPLYCSPEQAARETLDHRTDIWSWALVVLEMLLQKSPPWMHGSVAGCWMDRAEPTQVHPRFLSPMLADLWALLQHCLKESPADRPEHCDAIQSRLIALYKAATSEEYPRRILDTTYHRNIKPTRLERMTIHNGTNWQAPGWYLNEVSHLIYVKPDSQVRIPAVKGNSRRVLLLAEVRGFQRVLDWMARVRDYTVDDTIDRLYVKCLIDCSQVYFELEDFPGADQVLLKALEIMDAGTNRKASRQWQELMIRIGINLTESYRLAGQFDAAEEVLERVSEYTGLEKNSDPINNELKSAHQFYKVWAGLLASQRKVSESLIFFQRAYKLLNSLTEMDYPDLNAIKCMTLQSIAVNLGQSGQSTLARQYMEEAVALSQTWDERDIHRVYCLAVIHANMGNILNKINHPDALIHLQKAIDLISEDQSGDKRFSRLFCRAMLSKSTYYSRNLQMKESLIVQRLLNNFLEDQIYLHGHTELMLELLAVNNNLVAMLYKLRRPQDAIKVCHQGFQLAEYLQRNGNRDDVTWMEMALRANLVAALQDSDRYEEALPEIDRVIEYREKRINSENWRQMQPLAANVLVMKATTLSRLERFPEALEIASRAMTHCNFIDHTANWDDIMIKLNCVEIYADCLLQMNRFEDLECAIDSICEEMEAFNKLNDRKISEVDRSEIDLHKARCLIQRGFREQGIAIADRVLEIVSDSRHHLVRGIEKKICLARQILEINS